MATNEKNTQTTLDTKAKTQAEADAQALADARVRAEKRELEKAQAEEEAEAEAKAKAEADQKAIDHANELVETVFMKDNDKYKDDIIVGLNGKIYRIKRGVKVEVPRAVMDIIEQSNELTGKAADMQESASAEANLAKN